MRFACVSHVFVCTFLLYVIVSNLCPVLAEGINHEDGIASEALTPTSEFTETFASQFAAATGFSASKSKASAGFWRRRRRTPSKKQVKAAVGYNPPRVFTGGSHAGSATSLGDELQHTFKNPEHMPLTAQDALDDGWHADHDDCHPDLGVLLHPPNYGRENPLAAYFTPAGQIAGLKLTIWGSSGSFKTDKFKGPAALGNMVKQGYYIPVKGEAHTWEISVSFRSPSEVCSTDESKMPIGNQVVINQHTIKKSIPMTSAEAAKVGFGAGSCMKQMGQHWFYDLQSGGSKMTWNPGNLLPIVPMYAEGSNRINAFFFTTPACQYDSGHNWDNVPVICSLNAGMMCNNFCQSDCPASPAAVLTGKTPWKDPATYRWGTMHVFFNGHLDSVTCKGGDGMLNRMGRTCPANTPVAKAKAASRRRFWRV